jgi:hypothetical protein
MNRDDIQERRRRLEEGMAEAGRRREALKEALARRTGPAQPGDVFLFHGPAAADLRWAVVLRHPDRPLLFAVPADTTPLAGTADVEVPRDELGGPTVLRCGQGLWIHQDDFRPELRVALLGERALRRAQDKLEQIARGRVEGTARQAETDASPAYDDWLAEVAGAVEVLAETLRTRRRTVLPDEFRQDVLTVPAPAAPAAEDAGALQLDMAAAPALHELLGVAPEEAPPAWAVEFAYPGRLFLTRDAEGVVVRYFPAADQPAPPLHRVPPDGQAVAVTWKHTPNGKVHWAVLPWDRGQVVLRFGGGDRAKEIVVPQ